MKDDYVKQHYQSKTDKQIGQEIGISEDSVRRIRKRLGLMKQNSFTQTLEQNNFNPKWEYGWLKTDDVSVFIKNKEDIVKYEDVRDELLEDIKKYSPKYKKIEYKKTKDNHCLVIDPADVHIGKLSKTSVSGQEYNHDIAVERVQQAIAGITEKAKGFNINKIVLVIGNDILHTDNTKSTTTGGTFQDVSTMWHESFILARKVYVQSIETLLQIAPVHVVYNPSNHDKMSGFMLADAVQCWFSKCKDVTFDLDMTHRKYFSYGLNMISTSHGDGAKEQNIPMLMAHESPDMWSKTKFRYCYLHHYHHYSKTKFGSGKDYIGVTVEYLRSPSAPDSWHSQHGFCGSPQAIEGFIHSETSGQVAKLTHYF